jgi:endonuclease YncB( thermonuclease family)
MFEFFRNIIMRRKLEIVDDAEFFDLKCETLAKCVKVYDGDTIHVIFEYKGEMKKFKCRCIGYNCAEIKTKNVEEKNKAILCKNFVSDNILNKIIKINIGEFDKYGRILVDVNYGKNFRYNLKTEIIKNNLAKLYDGKGEKNW